MGRDERIDELMALEAVGALTPQESQELDALLAGDAGLNEEQSELRDAATVIAESASEAPPPHLRAAVLNAVSEHGTSSPADEPAPVVKLRHRRWMLPATAIAAAALLIVGALVIERIADAPTGDDVAQVVSDPRASTVMLTGPIGQLELYKSTEHDATVLMGRGIEAPAGAFVFQLWAIIDDEPHDMGTFMPAADGEVELMMDGVSPPDTRYAVTVEPAGGSPAPTGDHVAVSA